MRKTQFAFTGCEDEDEDEGGSEQQQQKNIGSL